LCAESIDLLERRFFDECKVSFAKLEPAMIEKYVETGEPMFETFSLVLLFKSSLTS